MSYKDKFRASQEHAHLQLAATKILRDLDDLRSKVGNSQTAPRRWVWELIQNAKDVFPTGGVRIRIEFAPAGPRPHVTFSHNGKPFTANDIRFLIEQISTKERKKGEEGKRTATGKFGTGFLTTHLLSDRVTIDGVAKEPDLDYRRFRLTLDRSSSDVDGITAAVQLAKQSVDNLDEVPADTAYKAADFNTSFRYALEDSTSLDVARAGIADLDLCLPYALLFVDEIESVEIADGARFQREGTTRTLDDGIVIISVRREQDNASARFAFARLSKGYTSIAIPVCEDADAIGLLPIEGVPRLFCDFPLIGTEQFPFPAIVNNPNFNPTDPRDGVFLTSPPRTHAHSEDNKEIMHDAVELYFKLLQYATASGWSNLHLLAQIPQGASWEWLDRKWLSRDVIGPIRSQLLRAEIVETSRGDMAAMLHDEKTYVWFPTAATKELRDRIWQSANDWFPHCLPRNEDVEFWYSILWPECGQLTVEELASSVQVEATVSKLAAVTAPRDVFDWLNELYATIREDTAHSHSILDRYSIFPDQNGAFRQKKKLYGDAGNIDDVFKDICSLLGVDIRGELADDRVHEDFEGTRDQAFAVRTISSEVGEKAADREVAKGYRAAFKKLLQYFRQKPQEAQKLFPALYRNKHHLYDDDEISQNLDLAEQLTGLLNEFKVVDVAHLRELLAQGTNMKHTLLPVTQEIILSMGITSPAEWAEALKDKDLALLFSHEKTPSLDMFVYAQGLIEQTKASVIAHLRKLPQYDLSQMDETAPTVLAGVRKNGQAIYIAIRPSHGGYVIVYYGSELDVLDYETSELWVCDGRAVPRRITLGHILKAAEIRKFPV